jgi:hypothetical protein
MKLALLITLDPRKPSLVIYSDNERGLFTEQSTYFITKGRRRRLNGFHKPFNSNIKLATQLFNGILKSSNQIDPSLVDTLPTPTIINRLNEKQTSKQQVLLEVKEENSVGVLEFVNTFLAHNKIRNYDDQFTSKESPSKILKNFKVNPDFFGAAIC